VYLPWRAPARAAGGSWRPSADPLLLPSASSAPTGWFCRRPYLYASYLMAATCVPYIVVKTILFRYGQDGVAAASILVISGLCSVFHVLAAR
jgi:hypothetical protein